MRTDVLSTIWKKSAGGVIYLPRKNAETGEWYEGDPLTLLQEYDVMNPAMEPWDRYYTPGTYRTATGARTKENHAAMGVLYADLDDKFHRRRLGLMGASLLTETSPGRYQAVWLLDRPLPVAEAESLNKRLSYWLEADHSSWIITKVLRIPESINWKRGGQKVKVVRWDPGRIYYADILDSRMPEVPGLSAGVSTSHPPIPTPAASKAAIRGEWGKLGHRTKKLLTISNPPDRSLHLSQLATRLAKLGLIPEIIWAILWHLPANKFRKRPQVLWESVILTAYERL